MNGLWCNRECTTVNANGFEWQASGVNVLTVSDARACTSHTGAGSSVQLSPFHFLPLIWENHAIVGTQEAETLMLITDASCKYPPHHLLLQGW